MKFIFQALTSTTVSQSKNYIFFFLSHMEEIPARLGQDSNRGHSTILTLHLTAQEKKAAEKETELSLKTQMMEWLCFSYFLLQINQLLRYHSRQLLIGVLSIRTNLIPNLEKAMAPHSSTLAWKIPWMEEPGRLQSMGSRRVGHDWATSLSLFTVMHWRRKWQPTPVFLPGESQGRGSMVGFHLWGCTESDATEMT